MSTLLAIETTMQNAASDCRIVFSVKVGICNNNEAKIKRPIQPTLPELNNNDMSYDDFSSSFFTCFSAM